MISVPALCTALALTAPLLGLNSTDSGRVEGRVLDARCGIPIAFVNVVLLGTSKGATTGYDGVFSIDGVPPGTYTLKAIAMTHEPKEIKGIEVDGTTAAIRDFEIEEWRRSNILPNRDLPAKTCEVNGIEMSSVIVPIGYGLKVMKPDYEKARLAQFPNAEPRWDGGCVMGRMTKARVLRCSECVDARNRYTTNHSWSVTSVGRNWRPHTVAKTLEIWMPANAEVKNSDQACKSTSTLSADSISVRVFKGPRFDVASEVPRNVDYSLSVLLGGVSAQVDVIESEDYAHVYVTFFVTPKDNNMVVIRVQMPDIGALGLATQIVNSLSFLAS